MYNTLKNTKRLLLIDKIINSLQKIIQKTVLMIKKIIFIFIAIISSIGLISCGRTGADSDFTYENIEDTFSGDFFRNRKFDYARDELEVDKVMKIPLGLKTNEIKPRFDVPTSPAIYYSDEVQEAKNNMLPPNYDIRYNPNKLIKSQIAVVKIQIVYNKKNRMKLVIREPLNISAEVIREYFKEKDNTYDLVSMAETILSGYEIEIDNKDLGYKYFMTLKKVDALNSILSVESVMHMDETSQKVINQEKDYIPLLNKVRKDLNGKRLVDEDEVAKDKQDVIVSTNYTKETMRAEDKSFSFGSVFGAGNENKSDKADSYSNQIRQNNAQAQQELDSQADEDLLTSIKVKNAIFDSNVKPQELN